MKEEWNEKRECSVLHQLFLGFLGCDVGGVIVGIDEYVCLLPVGFFPGGGSGVSIALSYDMRCDEECEYRTYWMC